MKPAVHDQHRGQADHNPKDPLASEAADEQPPMRRTLCRSARGCGILARFRLRWGHVFPPLPTLIAGLALMLLPGLTAADDSVIVLRFSHFLGPKSFFQRDLIEPWAQTLERRTNGQVRVQILSAEDPTGDVRLQSSNVRSGVVDIALGLRGAEPGNRFPGSSIVELPLIVDSGETGASILWSLYDDGTIASEYDDFKVLALFTQNPATIHTLEKRISSPADVAGLRIRASSEAVARVLAGLGAKPTILNRHDVIMGQLASRELDGIVTNWGNPLPQFDSLLRYHTDVPISAPAFFVLMNRARYTSLPTEVRDAIDALSGRQWSRQIGRLWNVWDNQVRERSLANGSEIITPDASTMRAWRNALRAPTDIYLDELSPTFPRAHEVYERLAPSAK